MLRKTAGLLLGTALFLCGNISKGMLCQTGITIQKHRGAGISRDYMGYFVKVS